MRYNMELPRPMKSLVFPEYVDGPDHKRSIQSRCSPGDGDWGTAGVS